MDLVDATTSLYVIGIGQAGEEGEDRDTLVTRYYLVDGAFD